MTQCPSINTLPQMYYIGEHVVLSEAKSSSYWLLGNVASLGAL
jgi:hypothetical protein